MTLPSEYRESGEKCMLTEVQAKSVNYIRIVYILKALLKNGLIDSKEYSRAKKYYRKLTGADIVIAN